MDFVVAFVLIGVFHLNTRVNVPNLQEQFGVMLRRRRLKAGLGQEEFADIAGLHRTHISLLERGKRMPTLFVVRKIARGLKTTMASLMAELERELADEGE